jgi:integrative and conjugative element protein (TIGR02256 family)
MLREASLRFPLETGGILLGVATSNDVWVEAMIGPGLASEHWPTRFVPDAGYQQGELARMYEESGRCLQYLGDWHTHPNGSPALSWTDRRTLRRIALDPDARQTRPLMMILGYGGPWKPAVSRYVGTSWYQPWGLVSNLQLELLT